MQFFSSTLPSKQIDSSCSLFYKTKKNVLSTCAHGIPPAIDPSIHSTIHSSVYPYSSTHLYLFSILIQTQMIMKLSDTDWYYKNQISMNYDAAATSSFSVYWTDCNYQQQSTVQYSFCKEMLPSLPLLWEADCHEENLGPQHCYSFHAGILVASLCLCSQQQYHCSVCGGAATVYLMGYRVNTAFKHVWKGVGGQHTQQIFTPQRRHGHTNSEYVLFFVCIWWGGLQTDYT